MLTRSRLLLLTLCVWASVAFGQGTAPVAAAPVAAAVVAAVTTSPAVTAPTAPAPAPAGATGPQADILNIVEARAATFINATTLVLAGLSRSVQWVVDNSTARQTGKIPAAKWFGPDFTKNGSWLAGPAAAMHASLKDGNDTAFVLRLSAPVYNATANSVYFTYASITAPTQLVLQGGAANSAVRSASTSPPAVGILLQDVALFVDDALPVAGATQDGNLLGGTKLGFEPLGGGFGRRGTSNAAGTYDGDGGGRGPGLVNVGLGGCYYPGGFSQSCYGYGYYGGAFG